MTTIDTLDRRGAEIVATAYAVLSLTDDALKERVRKAHEETGGKRFQTDTPIRRMLRFTRSLDAHAFCSRVMKIRGQDDYNYQVRRAWKRLRDAQDKLLNNSPHHISERGENGAYYSRYLSDEQLAKRQERFRRRRDRRSARHAKLRQAFDLLSEVGVEATNEIGQFDLVIREEHLDKLISFLEDKDT